MHAPERGDRAPPPPGVAVASTTAPTPAAGRRTLPHRAALPMVGVALVLMMASSAAPSPMYVIYQNEWKFAPVVLTAVFAVYALAVLVALLLFGSLSDLAGRRPVLLVALGAVLLSMVLFMVADGVGLLLVARVLQGLGVGTATGAVAASLIELSPPAHPGRGVLINAIGPTLGQGAGSLASGALVQYGPAPTVLPYALLFGGFAVLLALGWFLPETAPHAGGKVRIRPRRISIPGEARRSFGILSMSIIALWALGGLYGSLGPSFVAGLLHSKSHLIGGLCMAVLAGFGAVAQILLGGLSATRAIVIGKIMLLAGLAVVIGGVLAESAILFFAGSALLGLGWGTAFLGTFRGLSALADAERRGELLAGMYVVCYLGMSLPAIAAGFTVSALGLRATAVVFFAGVAVLSLLALAGLPMVHRSKPAFNADPGTRIPTPAPCGTPCNETAGVHVAGRPADERVAA